MVLILCSGVKKADDGSGFIFAGLGGGGASCSWWLHADKQTSSKADIIVCGEDFIIDILFFLVNTLLLFFAGDAFLFFCRLLPQVIELA